MDSLSSDADSRWPRETYGKTLFLLPVTFMFASFWPTYRLTFWLAGALGIPFNEPIRDHPNGIVWLLAFLVVMTVGMIAGALVGCVLGNAIARYFFRWPTAWPSRIPAPADLAEWEDRRKVGPVRFILTHGVLRFGLPMFLFWNVSSLIDDGFSGSALNINLVLLGFGLAVGVGTIGGLFEWRFSETTYQRLKRGR